MLNSNAKPAQLKPGDRVAIISPSWGGPSVCPHVYDSGLANMRSLGLEVVEFPTARADAGLLFSRPQMRADDINEAFADSSIQGIIASIGGSDSVRVLQFLDLEAIQRNPKFFMGFSDTSGYTSYFARLGLVSFNGPSVMAGFSQLPAFGAGYGEYFNDFLFGRGAEAAIPDFTAYSEGYPPWSRENVGKINPQSYDDGRRWLQGEKAFRGQLWGGCIEVLEMQKSTRYWPDENFWNDKVLFFETSEEVPPVDFVRYWLRNYGAMGVYDRIRGIMFSRARGYSVEEKAALDSVLTGVVGDEFGHPELPIASNLSFGHCDPQIILPLGIEVESDPLTGVLRLCESPFAG